MSDNFDNDENDLVAEIIAGRLFLGSRDHARDKELVKNRITLVVNVSHDVPLNTCGIKTHRVHINDGGRETFLLRNDDYSIRNDRLRETAEIIQAHLDQDPNHRVLVHCHAGISRSVTVVAAYLMIFCPRIASTRESAIRYIQSKRPRVDPCFIFHIELINLEKTLGHLQPVGTSI